MIFKVYNFLLYLIQPELFLIGNFDIRFEFNDQKTSKENELARIFWSQNSNLKEKNL